jgi:hypothetical protein
LNYEELGVVNEDVKKRIDTLKHLGITPEKLILSMLSSSSAYSFAFGYASQYLFKDELENTRGVTNVITQVESDRDQPGDHAFNYNDKKFISEHKVPKSQKRKKGYACRANISHRDKGRKILLPSGKEFKTNCIQVGEYDILAIFAYEYYGEARWIFCNMNSMPKYRPQKLPRMCKADRQYIYDNLYAKSITIELPLVAPWTDDLNSVLERSKVD